MFDRFWRSDPAPKRRHRTRPRHRSRARRSPRRPHLGGRSCNGRCPRLVHAAPCLTLAPTTRRIVPRWPRGSGRQFLARTEGLSGAQWLWRSSLPGARSSRWVGLASPTRAPPAGSQLTSDLGSPRLPNPRLVRPLLSTSRSRRPPPAMGSRGRWLPAAGPSTRVLRRAVCSECGSGRGSAGRGRTSQAEAALRGRPRGER